MKKGPFVAALAMMMMISLAAHAQNDKTQKAANAASSIYVISAKAGAVNFVSGEVKVLQKDAKAEGSLLKADEIGAGDKVTTKATGRAEILLNPGSYLRLGENSQFEFVSTALDSVEIKLDRGTAIFEVITIDKFKIKVKTPKSDFYLLRSGVYRIDVQPNGDGRLAIWKGRAQVGDGKTAVLKGGQSVVSDGSASAVARFDRDNKSELDLWSKARAKEIAKANASLMAKQMNRTLGSSLFNRSNSYFNGFGLWVQDPWTRSFCFLPFGYGWGSPYGYGFNHSIWNYQIPSAVYNNPVFVNNPVVQQPYNPQTGGNPVIGPNPGSSNGGGQGQPSPGPAQPRTDAPRMPSIVERKDPEMQRPRDN